jgi:DNA-binding transcriptional MerR regulator
MAKQLKRLFYKIGEVCELCGVEPHVLRFWESEFRVLSPTRNRSGQRIYRQKDLEMVERIKGLLYGEGYTISGARKLLESNRADIEGLPLFKETPKPEQRVVVKELKQGLQEVLTILDTGTRPVVSDGH